MKKKWFFLILLLLPLTCVSADIVLINSADWQDVYSGMLYSALNNKESKFLISLKHAELIIKELNKNENILLFESEKIPYVKDYQTILEKLGFTIETIKIKGGKNSNLQIAELMNVENFIIIDPTFGYSSVSVAPYAYITQSYVLFSDKSNIDSIFSFLKKKKCKKNSSLWRY